MHLILTGATGLIGTAVLDAMIRSRDITKISVLTRRPLKLHDDRVDVIIHKDFASYDRELLQKLQGAQACVWALGISQTQVDKEEYTKITKTFALAAANAFQSLPSQKEPFHFVFISGHGATFTPGLLTPLFGRVKGETELALAELQKFNPSTLRVTSVRPSFVDWREHTELKPYLPEIGVVKNVAGNVFLPLIGYAIKHRYSPTEPLGRFMAGLGAGRYDGALHGEGIQLLPGSSVVVENTGFRRLIGLDGPKE